MKRLGLIGRKVGMTQIFEDNERLAVTVVKLGPCTVVQKKTAEGKDGYNALQLGYDDKEHRKVSKPLTGHFKKADVKPKWVLREFSVTQEQIEQYDVGSEIKTDIFSEGQFVDVTGVSKGKGFAGVMKRHNMKGAKNATHGTAEQFRHVGSIGCRSTPGEVHKGKRLPGRMGTDTITTQNARIVKIDLEENVVLIHGSVAGPKNGVIYLRPAIKKAGKKLNA